MKTISLWQPWATLVAIGAKRIETRSWNTSYRGPLAIHASKTRDYLYFCQMEPFKSALDAAGLNAASLPFGAIVATCDLVGTDQFGHWINVHDPMIWAKGRFYFELTAQERAFGNFAIGRFGWFLANIKALPEPVPAKGSQGFWEWEE